MDIGDKHRKPREEEGEKGFINPFQIHDIKHSACTAGIDVFLRPSCLSFLTENMKTRLESCPSSPLSVCLPAASAHFLFFLNNSFKVQKKKSLHPRAHVSEPWFINMQNLVWIMFYYLFLLKKISSSKKKNPFSMCVCLFSTKSCWPVLEQTKFDFTINIFLRS